ncbi:polyprenyl synthetase family protein [Sinanaerobacter chloroacetimidivorans]|jgi:heptaprenyl diphosphate synthase|uniref:Polyprenyl synthetase family protein n=1 Tax=Sinanaerobacter chloroacetimidivorans TaxID=2818044 RepID=A0A8J7W1X6_9FIRM|nr:polyprenyl synthetase family protein [Sinanaerobacter chloroacetimidivorans]MBR0597410.1 polyprenyl synthetase family protein [Sinanaerobacter chloroacetimidivorans]
MLENLKNNDTINRKIQFVEKIMIKNVKSRHKNVQDMLTEMIHSGGKRLRPLFLLLSAEFGQNKTESLYEAAAGMEMIHMATLIHDDIIDEASLRRGTVTAQSRFGKDYAVFMGDFLMNRSYLMLNGKVLAPEVRQIQHIMECLFYGEMLQYNGRFDRKKTVSQYIRIAANKTASLFALSFFLGAKISECEESICKALKRTGYYFGISFQILDDLLDFSSRESDLGKNIQKDIHMGFYTLPMIFAAKQNPEIWGLIQDSRFDELQQCIRAAGGFRKAAELGEQYLEKANSELAELPDIEAKKIILHALQDMKNALQEFS